MGSLGSFGTPRPAVEDTFDYFGTDLRVNPTLSDITVMNLFTAMDNVTDLAGLGASMRQIGAVLVHSDDVEEFWRLATENRQAMEDLAALAHGLLEAVTDRPTKLPSGSSDGQSDTGTSSEDDSSSRALRLLEAKERPDLAVAVRRAQAEAATA